MGSVFISAGTSVEVPEFSGVIDLPRLIKDIRCDFYTDSYTIGLISVLGGLGSHASGALPRLRELADQKEKPLIKMAAEHAIKNITEKTHKSLDKPAEPHKTITPTVIHHERVKRGKEKTRVTLVPVGNDLMSGLKKLSMCHFCGKMFTPTDREKIENTMLSGGKIFCGFCLRNSYSEPSVSKDIMVISFRAIVGYVFHGFANINKTSPVYPTDVREMIDSHVKAGWANHLFKFDADTFTWFIDFGRVSENTMPLRAVLATVKMQLCALGCLEIFQKTNVVALVNHVESALTKFHLTREVAMPFLVTPLDAGVPSCKAGEPKSIPLDAIINFHPSLINDHRQKKYL